MSAVKAPAAGVQITLGGWLRTIFDLMRGTLCVSAFASAMVGYWLSIRHFDLLDRRAYAAALSTACAVAFANTLNDVLDVDIDHVNNARRPIPSGRCRQRDAVILSVLFCAASLALGLLAGPRMFVLALFALVASAVYDVWARNMAVFGNLVVAILGALTLTVGYFVVAGRQFPVAPVVCTLLFIFARELLGTVCDIEGDRAGGRTSAAMLWGEGTVLMASFVLAVSSIVVMCLAVIVGPVTFPLLYLACAFVTSIVPVGTAIAAIWRDHSHANIRRTSGHLKWVLMLTTISFLLLI
jgi:4-hydroxybenzoate polyprenyltransferase